ncbi:hypothetical protein [Microseira wollei]|uniref:PEP-CTERM protein-sorting domain-containing protein n=1 Tax=Microseira wollei NIES-4236 TaxID=2530354 RepID=A0AAV3X9S9_9CYAN|nr:hypothetical protein [Microseira wollei]GET37470.1 hypothetical protein MiSe_22230 [Microseira wollei NIES-4236]
MTKFKKLAVTTASVALSCTAIEANPAQAAVFNYDFTVNITSGFLIGNQYSGSFSYDDASPKTSFGGYRPFDFNFNFEGKTFSESDLQIDVGGYGGFFPNEGLVTASIGLYDFPPKPEDFPKIIFLKSDFYSYQGDCVGSVCTDDLGRASFGTVTYNLRSTPPTSVPEPSAVGGLMFLGLSSLLLKGKIASSQGE